MRIGEIRAGKAPFETSTCVAIELVGRLVVAIVVVVRDVALAQQRSALRTRATPAAIRMRWFMIALLENEMCGKCQASSRYCARVSGGDGARRFCRRITFYLFECVWSANQRMRYALVAVRPSRRTSRLLTMTPTGAPMIGTSCASFARSM